MSTANLNHQVAALKDSIFGQISKLSSQFSAVNLGQGFPDFQSPTWLSPLIAKTITELSPLQHQYAPSQGVLKLREKLAEIYLQQAKLSYHPESEILITAGATQGIDLLIRALINPGDEVVVLTPCYDSYLACLSMAQAQVKPVQINMETGAVDQSTLNKVCSAKTRLFILNTPHNPSGQILSEQSLRQIAFLANQYNFWVMSDEVYEHLIFPPHQHLSIAIMEGLKEKTIILSSAGKTFGHTGYKVGWALGPAEVINAMHRVQQYNLFCVAHPLQLAFLSALGRLPEYLPEFKEIYLAKRNLLVEGLSALGLRPIPPKGTYFALIPLPDGISDLAACHYLIKKHQVATIPLSSFYHQQEKSHLKKHYLRFCFAKENHTLERALEQLRGVDWHQIQLI